MRSSVNKRDIRTYSTSGNEIVCSNTWWKRARDRDIDEECMK